MPFILIITLLVASLSLNAYLLFRVSRKRARPQSVELQEFLADLLSGPAIVAVGRIDPANILLRSPKQR